MGVSCWCREKGNLKVGWIVMFLKKVHTILTGRIQAGKGWVMPNTSTSTGQRSGRNLSWCHQWMNEWMNVPVEGTNLQGRTNLSARWLIFIHHSPRRSWRPKMPYTYNALPYHANALSFSPYNDSLISVASSQNYGLVGNGKVLILQLSPSGITALNSYRFVCCVLTYQQVWYARWDIRHSLEWSSWEPTSRCVWRLFNQTLWHNT